MTNEAAFADQKLSSGRGYWQGRQVHFSKQRVRKCEAYSGPADAWDDEKAKDVLSELHDYFADALLPPPAGLPGNLTFRVNDDVMDLIQVCIGYHVALVRGETRRQVNKYQSVERLLGDVYQKGRQDAEDAMFARSLEQARQAERVEADRGRKVYFIASEGGPIKIGIAINPENRLRGLQTSHPSRLSILATCEGGSDQERAYHLQFADRRLSGEWFERCPEILAEIARLTPVPEEHHND